MKKFGLLVLLSLLCLSLAGCSWFPKDKDDDNTNGDNPNKQGLIDVKFNMTGVKALGIVDDGNSYYKSARDASDSENIPGGVVRITDEGAEAFITVPEGVTLSSVYGIWKNPTTGNDDVYILFTQKTQQYYDFKLNEETNEIENKYYELSQFIRVKSDGSFDDIIHLIDLEDNDTNRSISTWSSGEIIKFDKNGNVYFCVNESVNNISSSIIYKYDSVANSCTAMTVPAPNMSYEYFEISNDAALLIVKGRSGNGYGFIRVIPTATPSGYYDLEYSNSSLPDFYYDDVTSAIMYEGRVNEIKVFEKQEDGKYSKDNYKILPTSYGPMSFEKSIFFVDSYICKPNAKYYDDVEKTYKAELLLDDLFKLVASKITPAEYDFNLANLKDDYKYGQLYDVTKGKVNEEALAVLMADEKLFGLFYTYIGNRCDSAASNYKPYCCFCKKGTETSYYEENDCLTEHINVTEDFIDTETKKDCCIWNRTYSDPKVFLDYLFTFCKNRGKKYFTLKNMGEIKGYEGLAVDKKNEEAIEWLSEDLDRLENFSKIFMAYSVIYDKNGNNLFLYNTCFIEGTDEPAYKLHTNNNSISIYDCYVYDFFRNDKGLFAKLSNFSIQYIIQIYNEDGDPIMEVPESLLDYTPSSFEACKNGFVFDVRPSENTGAGYGFKLYYFNLQNDSVADLFTNLPNKESFELFSYTAAGENAYYSGISGFNYITCKVNIETLQNEISNIAYKLKDIVPLN